MTELDQGAVLALTVLLPIGGAVLTLASTRRRGAVASMAAVATTLAVVVSVLELLHAGAPLRYALGGWGAPLGIELALDGLSAVMLAMCALVCVGVGIHAGAFFAPGRADTASSADARPLLWPLALLLWAGLNALFLSADAFNVYVTLEVVSLASVALAALVGERESVAAALRYLLASMLASLCYLLGVALLYAEHATLDLVTLGQRIPDGAVSGYAVPLVVAGLALKCALFPLHFWLPRAHAHAPAPVSAALSALVVKAALYLVLRWWLDVLAPGYGNAAVANLLGVLGGLAVVWGSLQALLAARLKLVVAYSTVAQIGYGFLLFPLSLSPGAARSAWYGAVYLALAHGLAKAGMFLAAGNVMRAAEHDRVDQLAGVGERTPVSAFAFALCAISLVGLPFSGGFLGKWLLIESAVAGGRWWCVVVITLGSLIAAAFVLRVLRAVFAPAPEGAPIAQRLPARMEWAALGLALGATALGVAFPLVEPVLALGAPAAPGSAESMR